ncbi:MULTISPECIES: hypothetical protein [Cereibacter]|uniref:Uncharacterized protein n=1 Tax=Cereibacter azotoformans TaxID=43057 RepID=A0A2T5K781_9RHOB|nr:MULTISPECIES: hypothetical protein [Cereibacter]MBO4169531.1 hypothetical protein [Cereibacter azotoformans]MEA5159992.1 hypothetical protein [Cereibacter johrii]PTR18208.1 hypothetical protein C8J28_109168 [Cereibacter azotoformans]
MSTPPTPHRRLSDADIERLISEAASRAAEQAVRQAFGALGVDPSDPAHVRDWHADMLWTRSAREGSSRLSTSLKTTILGTIATAALYALWRVIQGGAGSGS